MKKDWMIKESDTESDDGQIEVLKSTLDKSCIVSGCAGSGKSVLALIMAKRIQKECGNDYKVIVFTKSLCNYMNTGKKELGLNNEFHYHEEWKWKRERRGRYMVYSKDDNGNKIPYMPTADYIIVDEIQDFSQSEILEFIAATKKHFFFFGDTAQSIFEGLKITIPVKNIKNIVPQNMMPVKHWELFYNHRLPVPVAKVADKVGIGLPAFDETKYKSKENALPKFLFYNSDIEQIEAIHRIIKSQDLSDVAILLPDNDYVIDVYTKLKDLGGNYELKYTDKNNFKNSKDTLDFNSSNPKVMTYHSAKGLQFDTVFIPYLQFFYDTPSNRKSLYVAMTRTYRNLYIMYSETLPCPLSNIDKSLYLSTEVEEIEDK